MSPSRPGNRNSVGGQRATQAQQGGPGMPSQQQQQGTQAAAVVHQRGGAQQPGQAVAAPADDAALTPAQRAYKNINARINRANFLAKIESVLPRHLKPEAMVQAALHIITMKPELLACSEESIAQSVFQISMWGLEIGRTAHIVAYGDQATAQQDWKGMVQRAINAGAITSCRSRLVYERDEFDVEYGLTERLKHVPHWKQTDRGEKVGVYAICMLPSGEQDFELLNREQVQHRRNKSKAASSNKGPWITDEDEMWRKTAVRLLLKRQPQASQIADEEDEDRLEALLRERQLASASIVGQTRRPAMIRGTGYDLDGGESAAPRNMLAEQAQSQTAAPGQGASVPSEVITVGAKPSVQSKGVEKSPDEYQQGDEGSQQQQGAGAPPQDSQGYPMVAWSSDTSGLSGWREMTEDERAAHDLAEDAATLAREGEQG